MVLVCASSRLLICAKDDSTEPLLDDGVTPTADIGPDEEGFVVGVGDACGG
jgi:hypothetical protein